jgi:acyl-CoA synthetase (NDP forming)
MSLHALFSARSIAVIGASDDPERIGGRPFAYLKDSWLSHGGRMLYAVNPTRREVQGMPAYASVAAIGAPVDVAVIAVPATRIEDAIADCANVGCKTAVIFSSGFGELGDEGRERQIRLHDIARRAGMRLLGPNCLGVIDVPQGLYATFSEAARRRDHQPGAISIASQSGAVAVQLLSLGRRLGVGMNKLISTGNEQDIDVAECIDFLATDASTRVIIAYLEGCQDGGRLVRALQRAQQAGKPVIVVKVGRSESGGRATLSHTGSLAGTDQVFDAVFRQYGALRVDSFDEAIDVAMLCAGAGRARGRRVGLMSISGGVGALMADMAEGAGLDVAPIPPSPAADALAALLSFSTLQNPLDITAQAINDMSLWRKNLEVMLAGNGYDALIAFLTFVGESPKMFDPVLDSMALAKADYPDTPIMFVSLCSPDARVKAMQKGFFVFEDANRAVKAVAGWMALGATATSAQECQPEPATSPIGTGALLNEFDAKQILARAGIRVPAERLAQDRPAAIAAAQAIGLPVVLKICSPDLPHKTEIGGVALNLENATSVGLAYDNMMQRITHAAPQARLDGVIVAEQLGRGVEMILGARRDPLFGTIIMLGFGGIYVEVLKDVALRRAPLSPSDIDAMIDELKAKALLHGARGQPASDVAALKDAIRRFASLAVASDIVSIEINPLLVQEVGRGAVALDCLIETGVAS